MSDWSWSDMQRQEDVGTGVRYFDGHADRVWHGPEGAREACAYYIGGLLGWAQATGTNLPDELLWIRDVQDAYSPKQRYRNWEIEGRERATREVEQQKGK